MMAMRKLVVTLAALLLMASAAFAHYHFLHYTNRTGPFTPVPEKFDLSALPNGALYFFVSAQGPEQVAPNDSFAGMLSQIRLAARAWTDVETSRLKLAFGGLFTPGTPQSTPGIDVLFDEVPPGLIALGGPTTRADIVSADDGAFVPISRSVLILPKDLSQRPSFSDSFFLTLVHEMGHTLGLQHTLTSSVMSTQVTRATTRSKPLADDDLAGLSLLYPTPDFASRVGSVSGRVTLDGQGVHLASVVAISPSGAAVGALSDPDGYYRIDGLPPGQYYLYAHSLPPSLQPELGPADIVLPVGPDGTVFPAGPLFETEFYPGTKNLLQAVVISIQPGSKFEGFDFSVQARGPLQLFGVTTYSFPGSVAVKPAFLNVNGPRRFLVASGVGLITNNAVTPGLRAEVVGGSARVDDDGVRAYPYAPSFLEIDFQFNQLSVDGPRHLVFSLNGETYILPAGLNLVQRQPPSISSVTPFFDEHGRRLAFLTGTGFSSGTRILFDGLPVPIFNLDQTNGSLTAVPPNGASNHRAIVTAVNSDGQDSLFLDASAVPTYTYDPAEQPFVTVSPNVLSPGSEAMITVEGVNTNFAQDQTIVGFGTSDIVVRRVWVLSPTWLIANVHVAPSAPLLPATLTVVTGFEIATQQFGLQIEAAAADMLAVNPRLVNPATGQPSIYAGGPALAYVANLAASEAPVTASLTLNDHPARIVSVEEGQITFEAPSDLNVGPVVLRLQVGNQVAQPIVATIDPPPPLIQAVSSESGEPVDVDHPAVPGEKLMVTVAGLADPGVVNDPGRVRVNVGGVDHTPTEITASESDPNVHVLRLSLSSNVPAGDLVPLTVTIDYRMSQPFLIPIRAVE